MRNFGLQKNKNCEKFENTIELDYFLNICITALNERLC